MHYWGDNWFNAHGNELYDAISYIITSCQRVGISLRAKEKWGMMDTEYMELSTNDLNKREKQIKEFNRIHQEAFKIYPAVIDELILDNDYSEYIVPCEYGNINAEEIKEKYRKLYDEADRSSML